jgi:hypothetical protein
MNNWEKYRIRRERQDRQRRRKLLTKLQKAQALEQRETVERLPSWGRRFGAVIRLRSQREDG